MNIALFINLLLLKIITYLFIYFIKDVSRYLYFSGSCIYSLLLITDGCFF